MAFVFCEMKTSTGKNIPRAICMHSQTIIGALGGAGKREFHSNWFVLHSQWGPLEAANENFFRHISALCAPVHNFQVHSKK